MRDAKKPRVEISDQFAFDTFEQSVDRAIAQALFCHLSAASINDCFTHLRPVLVAGGVFYATYFEVDTPRDNPEQPHAHGYFAYTIDEMMAFGRDNGFQPIYHGQWGHPHGQVMVEYRKP